MATGLKRFKIGSNNQAAMLDQNCRNVTKERYKFFTRKQRSEESIEEFVEVLSRLSINCNLGHLRDSLVKDMLIRGLSLSYEGLKIKLLNEDPPCLKTALSLRQDLADVNKKASAADFGTVAHKPIQTRDRITEKMVTVKCEVCGVSHKDATGCPGAPELGSVSLSEYKNESLDEPLRVNVQTKKRKRTTIASETHGNSDDINDIGPMETQEQESSEDNLPIKHETQLFPKDKSGSPGDQDGGRKKLSCNRSSILKKHAGPKQAKTKRLFRVHSDQFYLNTDVNHDRLKKDLLKQCVKDLYSSLDRRKLTQNSESKPYNCMQCDKSYLKWSTIKRHVAQSHPDSVDSLEKAWPNACKQCGMRFENDHLLKCHIFFKHHRPNTMRKPYKCSHCWKSYFMRSKFKSHVAMHLRENCFICDFCQKAFVSKSQLQAHFVTCHSGERPFMCSLCGKCFPYPNSLRVHSCIYNRPNKTYFCNFCGKGFVQKGNLNVHIRHHTGFKPHQCSECGKCFVAKSTLEYHVQAGHNNKVKYQCNICETTFEQKSELEIHERMHNGLPGFTCKTCGREFSRKFTLMRHLIVHTGEKPFWCTICDRRFSQKKGKEYHMMTYHGTPSKSMAQQSSQPC